MPRCTTILISLFFLFNLLPASWAFAGELDKFEEDATKVKEDKPSSQHNHNDDDSFLGDIFAQIVISAGKGSLSREGYAEEGDTVAKRQQGDRLLPRARLDVAGQFLEHDISAVDLRGEVGYAAFAGQVRYTRMWEDSNGNALTTTYGHFLLRMALGSKGEMDLGVGALNLAGRQSTTGVSMTLPIQVHGDNFGVEARPAWSALNDNVIQDYDVALVAGVRFVALRAGYRWLLAPHETLKGPYAGVSLSW